MHENSVILIADENSPMKEYISQTLINHGFSTIRKNEEIINKNTPIIISRLNNQSNLSNNKDMFNLKNIENLLAKNNLTPHPIIIITTQTEIAHLSRLDHIGAIVEIQIDRKFNDIISSYKETEDHIKQNKLPEIGSFIDTVGEIIHKYVHHPPSKDEYVIEEVAIKKKDPTIGVVGLGYVGLPVAVGFSEKYKVIGFDINKEKIESLQENYDWTGEMSYKDLEEASIEFTTIEKKLRQCDFIIVVVPTPITSGKDPDLTYLKNASKIVGRNLSPGTVVIYESTVYPGTTEEICIPLLEAYSQLIAEIDFHVAYSPERINPGDKKHTFKKNNKVISGQNEIASKKTYDLYNSVIEADVYKAPSIKIAEASKIVENTQRDINIAFMNELAMIFDALKIDTAEVLKAAQTKWNFLPFTPGLVGGHCIGVDPYYLIYQSKLNGYEPRFISEARQINDHMPQYIVQSLLELMVSQHLNFQKLRITLLGITFKEDISDIRNSKPLEILNKLQKMGLSVQVCDPMVSSQSIHHHNPINLRKVNELEKAHVVILAVPHQQFKYKSKEFFKNLLINDQGIVMDIKSTIPDHVLPEKTTHWKP